MKRASGYIVISVTRLRFTILGVFLGSSIVIGLGLILKALGLPCIAILGPQIERFYLVAIGGFLARGSMFMSCSTTGNESFGY